MRIIIISICFILFLQSCNSNNQQKEPFKSLLSDCTEVGIVFYNSGDTLNFKTADSSGVKLLKQTVNGSKENMSDTCAPMGALNFLNNSGPALSVQFAVKKVADKLTCNYITYTYMGNTYKHKLSVKGKDLLLQLGPK